MQIRAAMMNDLTALTELFQAIELAEIGRAGTTEADIRQILLTPGLDLERYSRSGNGRTGRPRQRAESVRASRSSRCPKLSPRPSSMITAGTLSVVTAV
ncbi:hypothetical protein [Streptosporangium minutum]|uniref:hypothetical protein n=1 Tax=Streptosporangium minutum TaxID=569862 RepID=UPI0013FDE389|nr:hypothetical protein [Streptosporangium minutum]